MHNTFVIWIDAIVIVSEIHLPSLRCIVAGIVIDTFGLTSFGSRLGFG